MGLVKDKEVPLENIDEEEIMTTYDKINADAAASAKRAAQESLVLLKNEDNVIPANRDKLKYVFLLGEEDIDVMVPGPR